MKLEIQRLDKDVELVRYAKDGDAGFDLRASHEENVPAGEKRIIKTGIKMAIPAGYVGFIWDRSGMAAKHQMHTLAGVVDAGYRGEVGVVIKNLSDTDFLVEKNMRIAQMVVQPFIAPDIVEVSSLDETERSDGGFGSSGMH